MSRRRWGALLYLTTGVLFAALAFTADTDALRVLAGIGAALMVLWPR